MATVQGNLVYSLLDEVSGEYVNFTKVTTWHDGTAMDDSKCDGIVWRKKGSDYYKRILVDNKIYLKWWGIVENTDIITALSAAYKAGGRQGHLVLPVGDYNCSNTWYLNSFSSVIEGEQNSWMSNTRRTVLHFPSGKDGIMIARNVAFPGTTLSGGMGGTFKRISLTGPGKTDPADSNNEAGRKPIGIGCYSTSIIEDVEIGQFSGDGLVVYGAISEGLDVSLSYFLRVSCSSNGRHGLWTVGPDANQCTFQLMDLRDNGVCGVLEQGFLGNLYIGCHCNGNGWGNFPNSFPYKVVGASNRSAFVMCYSEQQTSAPGADAGTYGDGCSDFGGAWVFGGLHGNSPYNGKIFNDFIDSAFFKARHLGDADSDYGFGYPNSYIFDKGLMITQVGDGDINVSVGKGDEGTFENKGALWHIASCGNGGLNMTPYLSLLGSSGWSADRFGTLSDGEFWSQRAPGPYRVIMNLRYAMINSRRIAINPYFSLDKYLNTSVEGDLWGQWHKGDLIINAETDGAAKNIIGWRCTKNGTLRRLDSDLAVLGSSVSFTGSGVEFPTSLITMDALQDLIKIGDCVKESTGPSTGWGVISGIRDLTSEGTASYRLETAIPNAFSGGPSTGTLVWDNEPTFEPIMMPGHLHPDHLPPVYADEAAAIAAGLGNGDFFFTTGSTVLNVVLNDV